MTNTTMTPAIILHAVRIWSGLNPGYADAIRLFWLGAPTIGLLQVVMLSVVWVQGRVGLFT